MASKVIYACDRCKAEAEKLSDLPGSQLWSVFLDYKCRDWREGEPAFPRNYIPAKAEWCRKCMEEMGLMARTFRVGEDLKVSPSVPPTLESQIREIVREEIQAAQQ